EESTIATVQQASPCFNNLVYYDPTRKVESVDTVVPELAEKWSWQDNYRNLVFFLRKDVKWHDGKPFTAQDVKYTFDVVRGAPDAGPVQEHVRRHRPVQAQGQQARPARRVRAQPPLLREGPAVPGRHQVRDHPRPLHADRRAAVGPARRVGQRLEQDQRRERQ